MSRKIVSALCNVGQSVVDAAQAVKMATASRLRRRRTGWDDPCQHTKQWERVHRLHAGYPYLPPRGADIDAFWHRTAQHWGSQNTAAKVAIFSSWADIKGWHPHAFQVPRHLLRSLKASVARDRAMLGTLQLNQVAASCAPFLAEPSTRAVATALLDLAVAECSSRARTAAAAAPAAAAAAKFKQTAAAAEHCSKSARADADFLIAAVSAAEAAGAEADAEGELFEERVQLFKLKSACDSFSIRRALAAQQVKQALAAQRQVLAAGFARQHGCSPEALASVQKSGLSLAMSSPVAYVQLPAVLEGL